MKKSILPKVMASLLLLMVLVSCNMKSEEDALNEAKEAAENSFKSADNLKPNQKLTYISLYLPERFQMESEEKSNLILKDDEQTYIVFYNDLEPATSEFGASSSRNEEALLFDSFKDKTKFGFIRMMPENDEKYEMVVGVGGVKITTYTTKHDMEQDAEDMMQISRSLVEQNENNIK